MSGRTLQIKQCKLVPTKTVYETILPAQKSVHANIKFVKPWNMMQSQWKLRQQHDQNFPKEGKPL